MRTGRPFHANIKFRSFSLHSSATVASRVDIALASSSFDGAFPSIRPSTTAKSKPRGGTFHNISDETFSNFSHPSLLYFYFSVCADIVKLSSSIFIIETQDICESPFPYRVMDTYERPIKVSHLRLYMIQIAITSISLAFSICNAVFAIENRRLALTWEARIIALTFNFVPFVIPLLVQPDRGKEEGLTHRAKCLGIFALVFPVLVLGFNFVQLCSEIKNANIGGHSRTCSTQKLP